MDIIDSINRYLSGANTKKSERTRLTRARDEIVRLRKWIEEEGQQSNTCTYYVLGKDCSNCLCGRSQK